MEKNKEVTSATTPSFQIPKAYLRYVSFLEFISFGLAAKEIRKRFFTPIPFSTPDRERPFLESAQELILPVGDRQITLHQLGTGSKTALFIHGWSGRGSQAYALASQLVERDYRFVAITAQAHGNNPGKRTHMLQFADAIKAAVDEVGEIDVLIAHSIGGAAAFNAVASGVKTRKLVILGAPSSITDVIDDFCTRLQLDDRYRRYLENYLKENYHPDIEALSPRRRAEELGHISGLIVHDRNDIDVHFEQAEALHKKWSNSSLMLTDGLGHRRILSDSHVIEEVLTFLK